MKNNILIIEDDQDIREGIRILLEGEGFAVEEVSNGMEGLKKTVRKNKLGDFGYYDAGVIRIENV